MLKVMLRKTRMINPCGRACHLYVPQTLQGKEVVGLILKDSDDVESRNEYTVTKLE